MGSRSPIKSTGIFNLKNMKDFIEGEIWKDVPEFEGYYQVSNFGRIYSLPKLGKGNHNGKILKQFIASKYLRIILYKSKCSKSVKIHRLVATLFVNNPQNKPCVDHIDGDRLNNKADNLRWCTLRENLNFDNVKRKTNSDIKGVKATKHNSYYYQIYEGYKKIKSKSYKTIEETKTAYDNHMEELHKKDLLLLNESL